MDLPDPESSDLLCGGFLPGRIEGYSQRQYSIANWAGANAHIHVCVEIQNALHAGGANDFDELGELQSGGDATALQHNLVHSRLSFPLVI